MGFKQFYSIYGSAIIDLEKLPVEKVIGCRCAQQSSLAKKRKKENKESLPLGTMHKMLQMLVKDWS
jgi:hypothetical protein